MPRLRDTHAPYGWQLVSPLSRLNSSWSRHNAGLFTFLYPPGQHVDRRSIRAAIKFVRHLAEQFDVSPPRHLTVSLAASATEMDRIRGLEFYARGVDLEDRAVISDGTVILPDKRSGEYNRHELTRAVIQWHFMGADPLVLDG